MSRAQLRLVHGRATPALVAGRRVFVGLLEVGVEIDDGPALVDLRARVHRFVWALRAARWDHDEGPLRALLSEAA